jgi:hypothetical protein
MKTALFAMVLVGCASCIGLVGCATDVDDPVEPAPAAQPQKDPPAQTLSGELRDPQQQLLSGIGADNGLRDVPSQEHPRLPTPTPEQH